MKRCEKVQKTKTEENKSNNWNSKFIVNVAVMGATSVTQLVFSAFFAAFSSHFLLFHLLSIRKHMFIIAISAIYNTFYSESMTKPGAKV